MNNHFVYVYYDGTTPFYVGMGSQNRHLDHIKYARRAIANAVPRNKLSHKLNKIINLLLKQSEPRIEFAEKNLTVEAAKSLEIQLISEFGRADLGLGPLTNLTNGGDGVIGRTTMIGPDGQVLSILKEDKLAYEAIGFRHFNKNRKHSPETNRKKSAPWAGLTRPEHGAKIKEAAARGAFKNRKSRGPHSEDTLVKMRAPKIKREGYQNRRWYHSPMLNQEQCINTIPDWPDVQTGRLPKKSTTV